MNSNNFSIDSKVQNVEIHPNETSGSFEGYMSYLEVYAHFVFRVPNARSEFDVLSITASLNLLGDTFVISKTVIHSSITIRNHDSRYREILKFELTKTDLEYIEQRRNGDANFTIELDFQILQRELSGIDGAIKSTIGLTKGNTFLQLTIPKSIWAEKILKRLGYNSFKLIEIPLHHLILEEAYDDILSEFNQAEQYFVKQDYNKCIAHCRSTLDALTRNLKKIKAKEPSESKFKWLETVSKTSFDFIDGINKANSAISSKTHHAGKGASFGRQDAESIYLVSLALLHYINSLK